VNLWHPDLTEVEVEFLSAVSANLWRERSSRHLESLEAVRRVLDGQRWWISPA
jgi:hypothetical protein